MTDLHAVADAVVASTIKQVNDASGASLTQAQYDEIVGAVRRELETALAPVFALIQDPAVAQGDGDSA